MYCMYMYITPSVRIRLYSTCELNPIKIIIIIINISIPQYFELFN